ncbi:endonuclease/exonuclease/phosphatase family protein [Enterocloster citroniae]|uniref:Endonuclease/exonuclease/phosphatase family protein n=2 Tax=Enterocloster citroniae TaxID=358743 RepID=A0ABV2G3E9_9FIRM|nr:endonuclease/exonuclease/phosphatase family protein [Enterocloster citroniae]KMW23701.1 hypothetical protein HMPREF9470_00917 [[Clostridium] citroniae WAL-19142]
MINIMFWNANAGKFKNHIKVKGMIDECICSMIVEYKCDIFVLAEYEYDLEALCNRISIKNRDFKIGPSFQHTRVKMIMDSRLKSEVIRDNNYFVIYSIQSLRTQFLLAGVHFPSKMHGKNGESGELIGRRLIFNLIESEKVVMHEKAVIIGDFNANPFEPVMLNADMMHSYPRADFVLNKKVRKVYDTEYSIYYNPMWNLWGDEGLTGGTYHYDAGGVSNLCWNIYDQVILSHDMVNYFLRESLEIVNHIGDLSLLNKRGIPDSDRFSDHLPIFFSLKEDI